jgi:hypothetical protein
MSTQNGQHELNEHEQRLLEQIETVVASGGRAANKDESFPCFCAHLASTVPRPDAAFQQQLETRLVAQFQQRKETTAMNAMRTKRGLIDWLVPRRNSGRLSRPALRIMMACLVAVVLGAGWLASAITAQARVERMAQRFGLIVINTEVIDEPSQGPASHEQATTSAQPVPEAQAFVPKKLSFAEAQRRTPFPIRLPTWLPAEMTLTALDVGEGGWGCSALTMEDCAKIKPPVSVHVLYRPQDNTEANLALDVTEITPEGGGGVGVPASDIQLATVHGQPAVYVQGAWQQKRENDPRDLVWNKAVDQQMLSWQEHGQTYVLSSYQLGLSREDMIRIAESIR